MIVQIIETKFFRHKLKNQLPLFYFGDDFVKVSLGDMIRNFKIPTPKELEKDMVGNIKGFVYSSLLSHLLIHIFEFIFHQNMKKLDSTWVSLGW